MHDRRRILLVGGAGFLGSHLADRLIGAGHEVICVDNFHTGRKDNILHLLGNPWFELCRHDVTLPLYVEVDAIYNLACPASPLHYQRDPVQTLKTCVHGSINLLGLAKRLHVPILLASTSEVYGDPQVHPQTEDYWGHVNPIGQRSCYDEGKRCAETLFFDYGRQYRLPIKVASTPMGRACIRATAGWSPNSSSRRSGARTSRSTAMACRPARSATSTSW